MTQQSPIHNNKSNVCLYNNNINIHHGYHSYATLQGFFEFRAAQRQMKNKREEKVEERSEREKMDRKEMLRSRDGEDIDMRNEK